MSARWDSEQLVQPITAERPCGENLEDTSLLASFDTFHLFGHSRQLEPRPDWGEMKERAIEVLASSKDLRLLAHLAAALLRTDGLPAFSSALAVAARWLQMYWNETYPLIDGDALLRRNALNCLADRLAVVDGLRRLPLADSHEHGRFSLRDLDIAAGIQPCDEEGPRDRNQIDAAFATTPADALEALEQGAARGVGALKEIEARMRDEAGADAAPTFDRLLAELVRIQRALRDRLAARANGGSGAPAPARQPAAPVSGAARPLLSGPVNSREDATRTLDAVAEFFRRHEPSSPVPLLVERAKRLVSKDFLDVLADIAPDGVAQARSAGGLRGE